MSPVSGREIERQYRVLQQTLSAHSVLKHRYARRALFVDIVLLACSVVFCATTFARDDVFIHVGLSPANVRFILGTASIAAFFASLIALRVNWKGTSALHEQAMQKLTDVLTLFRRYRREDGGWFESRHSELSRAYWDAVTNVVRVPDRVFLQLKAWHLRKVQISRMLDSNQGCPVFVLRLVLLWRSLKKIWTWERAGEKEPANGVTDEDISKSDETG